jgi:hypothetical protein
LEENGNVLDGAMVSAETRKDLWFSDTIWRNLTKALWCFIQRVKSFIHSILYGFEAVIFCELFLQTGPKSFKAML